MHDFRGQFKSVPCNGVFVVIHFKTMCNKTIIRFGFCDIRIIKVSVSVISLSLRLASADNTYLDLDYCRYHKRKPHPIIVYKQSLIQ